jgi:hypothetical protein
MYHSRTQHSDCHPSHGFIKFTNNNDNTSIAYPLYQENGLWFYSNEVMDYTIHSGAFQMTQPINRKLTPLFMYALIRARMGHPGE